ncbi:phosphotransferase-like protein [Rickettsiales endosymbiont of Stachyamoeba lipophora]|uniref:phosphotransferase-like protein n=1 Tax=Rickettsiales endosymbiont of Stachyamoeba lipophora TaxID=2486578 RepID=UPI0013DDA4CD|nr:AAA family ATPase [Rickettsiales endosymbiont of Stachyamoeba lipophora]
MTKCIILNGASSSGKSTIIKALQTLMPDLAHVRLSDIAFLYFGMFHDNYFHDPEWGEVRYKRQVAIREMVIAQSLIMLKQGFDICIDTTFDGPKADEMMQYYLGSLKDFNPIMIGIICDLEVLEQREIARGDRKAGWGRAQIEDGIHQNRPYAFTVDNTTNSPEETTKIIFNNLKNF